jgi:hypothetical protein
MDRDEKLGRTIAMIVGYVGAIVGVYLGTGGNGWLAFAAACALLRLPVNNN